MMKDEGVREIALCCTTCCAGRECDFDRKGVCQLDVRWTVIVMYPVRYSDLQAPVQHDASRMDKNGARFSFVPHNICHHSIK